jgi:5-hydroxyisourate hydrolase-like protein (transthyretin family)
MTLIPGIRFRLAVLLAASIRLCSVAMGQAVEPQLAGRVVSADTGLPIANAKVELIPSTDPGNGFLQNARTDPDGRYRFDSVHLGSYSMSTQADGFVTQEFRRDADLAGASVTIAETTHLSNIDFALSAAGEIHGMVVDPQGHPAGPGIFVAAVQRSQGGDGSARRMPTTQGVTDADGKFILRRLAPGKYYVCINEAAGLSLRASKPGATFRESGIGEPDSIDQAHTVDVKANGSGEAIRIVVPGVELHSLTVDPVWYAEGREDLPKPEWFSVVLMGKSHPSRQQSDGSYVIPDLPSGNYTLVVTAWNKGVYAGQGETSVAVLNSDQRIQVQVGGLGEIGGRVQLEGDIPANVSSLLVSIQSTEGAAQGAQVEGDGGFKMDRVLPGHYNFQVLVDRERRLRVVGATCGGVETREIVIRSEQKIDNCTLRVSVK